MSLYASKLLPLFVYPLGLALLVGCAVAVACYRARRRRAAWSLTAALLYLWIAATPLCSNWLIGTLERGYPERPVEALPRADLIVVLGGSVVPAHGATAYPLLADAVDRVLYAWRLFRAERAPRILLSGGLLPWSAVSGSEAAATAELLVGWGVPREAITLETGSRNTVENARHTAALLTAHGGGRILLVTSAFHMPRALATFRVAGVDALPASTDLYAALPQRPTLLGLLPDAGALRVTTMAIKEYLGLAWYAWKGWV